MEETIRVKMETGVDRVKVKFLEEGAKPPHRAHPHDAGADLFSVVYQDIEPGWVVSIPTGIAVAIPEGHVGLILDRSSLGWRGIKTFGGVIDAGYTGALSVLLGNLSASRFHVAPGDRIAQLVILPVALPAFEQVEELGETERGAGGFGSTGR